MDEGLCTRPNPASETRESQNSSAATLTVGASLCGDLDAPCGAAPELEAEAPGMIVKGSSIGAVITVPLSS